MAGSYTTTESTGSDVPEMLYARIEGLKLLAHHLDEPIVIFNPQMELVYANPSADKLAKACPLIPSQSTLPFDSDLFEQTPCDSCPATHLFKLSDQRRVIASSPVSFAEPPAMCPLPRAVPMRGETGTTHFAVLMGTRGSESVVAVPKAQEASDLPAQQGPPLNDATSRTIIGESEPIQRLVEMIQLVAASGATVLIQGESGTGKELVARTIHALSRRRALPFVVVECSSLPETLLESELFGHVRGAFTGAVADRCSKKPKAAPFF
jgi:hypothetical protein